MYSQFINAAKIRLTLGNPYLKYPHYFFCSFQKSGRTWLRFILGNYLNILLELGLNIDFHNIYSVLPSLTEKKRIAESYQFLAPSNTPIILFTHLQYNPFLFRKEKIFFMVRSIYDTLVSFYFHNSKHHRRYEKGIKSFIKEPSLGVPRWINYMNRWAPRLLLDNCYIITYERLYLEPIELVSDILRFLNIPNEISIVQRSIDLSSFENMKKIEITKGIIEHNHDRKDNNALRIRKGGIGKYTDFLDSKDVDYIHNQCVKYLNVDSKKLLEKVNIRI